MFLGYIFYRFVNILFKVYHIKKKRFHSIFIAVLLFVSLVAQLPSLFELFYWYAAVTAYLWSFIFFLLLLECALRFHFFNTLYLLPFASLIILINGNNEILLGLTNFIVLSLLLKEVIIRKQWNLQLILLNLISWISSLVVILAPGTIIRRENYDYGGDLYGSIKVAIIYGGKYIIESFFQFPLLIFLMIVFLMVYRATNVRKIKLIGPLRLLLVSYLSIISIFFVLFYAKGLLGVHNGRIGNITIWVTSIFFLLNIFNLAVYVRQNWNVRFFHLKFLPHTLTLILVFLLIFNNKNYLNVRKDLTEGNLITYKEKMEDRMHVLAESEENNVILAPVKNTLILRSDDSALEKQEWMRRCYKNYINNIGNRKIDFISIKYTR